MGRSSRKRAKRREQKRAEASLTVHAMTLDGLADFTAEWEANLEPLTAALIEELAGQGMPREDLELMAAQGMRYSRERNSFRAPLEYS